LNSISTVYSVITPSSISNSVTRDLAGAWPGRRRAKRLRPCNPNHFDALKLVRGVQSTVLMKTTNKSLKLSKTTLRTLSAGQLAPVAGGAMNNSNASRCWASGCTCLPPI
jgi:hypothetical protein